MVINYYGKGVQVGTLGDCTNNSIVYCYRYKRKRLVQKTPTNFT